jgi:hypothetical protein
MENLTILRSLHGAYSNRNTQISLNDEINIDQRKLSQVVMSINELANLSEDFIGNFRRDVQFNIGNWFLKNFNPIKNSVSVYAQNVEFLNKFIESRCQNQVRIDEEQCFEFHLNELLYKTNTADVHSLLFKPIKHILNYPDVICEILKVINY